MRRWVIATLLLTAVAVIQESDAYKVLFIGAVGSRSHKNFYMGLINELTGNGNHVTLVTPFPSKGDKANVREVGVPVGDLTLYGINRFTEPAIPGIFRIRHYYSLCVDTLADDQVQNLLQERFDVVFITTFFCDCYLSMAHQLQVPFVLVSPVSLLSINGESIGNPSYPCFVTVPIFEHRHPLTFLQRTINVLAETAGGIVFDYGMRKLVDWDCRSRGLCPDDMPPLTEIQKNVSLVFVNSVRELDAPARPFVPGVVHIGGIHCRPAEPLPQDLGEWIDGAGEDGFIFFSLGSTVVPSDLPEKNRQILAKVFSSLKQRVLWKWDKESMPGMPPNVRIGKWLPQQDILGHPKLRLFITHGGLLSTFESIYHGRAVLGLPVFADQMSNMKEVDRQGWGKVILWDDLTEEILLDKINSVMADEKMHQEVQLRSNLMRDQPISPRTLVSYWTDYIIRYKGARHLRCPMADMSWFKIYNMDVWITLMMVAALTMWLIGRLICAIVKKIQGKPKDKKE